MPSRIEPRRGRRGILLVLAVTAMMAMSVAPIAASTANVISFDTPQAPMMNNLVPGGTVDPLVTVGETLGSMMFEALPDGISIIKRQPGSIDMLINHETSTVPFPYNVPPSASNLNDFKDSLVSNLRLKISTRKIIRARYIINDGQNFHRFCSNYLATAAEGFDRKIFMTNEEGSDWVNKDGLQWPVTIGDDNARQIGAVIARDLLSGETRPIWGMGRLNHENSLALKYPSPIVLTGDDTFLTNPASSQLYMYGAGTATDLFNDNGTLYAFVSDNLGVNDYYDFAPGTGMSVSGHFIPVPKEIATGKNPNGTDMVASEVPGSVGGPYPAPGPGDMTNAAGTTTPVDGPQWILEHWGDLHNVFSFVRIEDMAYDKRPGMSNVVYMIDSGRGVAGPAPAANVSTNGRIWKLVLDPNDPATVWSLSVLIEGDDNPVKTLTEIRQPDNIESTMNGLYITEDPGSSQQFAPADPAGVNARVWQYKFSDSSLNPVLEINQSADEGPTDVDTSGPGNKGSWEASGIIDVSKYFGAGYFLLDVQAHTLFTQTQPGPDIAAPAGPDWTYKREGGQLLLVYIPGA
jgi:hypothetical protein